MRRSEAAKAMDYSDYRVGVSAMYCFWCQALLVEGSMELMAREICQVHVVKDVEKGEDISRLRIRKGEAELLIGLEHREMFGKRRCVCRSGGLRVVR